MIRMPLILLAVLLFFSDQAMRQATGQTIGPLTGYEDIAASVKLAIEHEIKDKGLAGAISVAIVADQQIVWADGFGIADPQSSTPATAQTMYRVGSVSKLFTDIGVMQLVQRGELELTPRCRPSPDFRPEDPFTNRSRFGSEHPIAVAAFEAPLGNYFDDSNPSLAETVASLNATKLVLCQKRKPSIRTLESPWWYTCWKRCRASRLQNT